MPQNTTLQFQELIDGLGVGVLVQGPQTEILVSNQAALDLLGLSQDQLLGKTSFDPSWNVIHEDGSPFPGSTLPVPVAIATGQPVNNVVMGVYRPKYNDRVWLLVNANPRLSPDGILCDVICTFSDITAQKQIEVAMQAILKTIPDAILRVKADGTIMYFQPAQGVPFIPKTLRGEHIANLIVLPESDSLLKLICTAIATNKMQFWQYQISVHGRIQEWELRIAAMGEDQALIISRNVTAEKQHARDQLELERGRLLKQFIDNVSHDLRTPLTILNTSIYLLRRFLDAVMDLHVRHGRTPDTMIDIPPTGTSFQAATHQIYGRLVTMEDNIAQLTQIVDAIIEVTELDEEYAYQFTPNDLNRLAQRAYDDLFPLAEAKQIALQLELSQAALPVSVDTVTFIRAIKHVLENAIDYTPSGGVVAIQVYLYDRQAIFEVQDTGIGISHADLPHIFARFFRVDKARDPGKKHYGLGLSIAKEIVEAHQGRIDVQSEPEHGSVFDIVIPLACSAQR